MFNVIFGRCISTSNIIILMNIYSIETFFAETQRLMNFEIHHSFIFNINHKV